MPGIFSRIRLAVIICLLAAININAQNAREDLLRKKIGQMIMVGVYGPFLYLQDSLKYDLQHRSLGGVIYYGYNVLNPQQVKNLSDSIRLAAPEIPPFIAIDQEGGNVARLTSTNGFSKTYTAYRLGSIFKAEDSTRAQASRMAGWLNKCGISVNFAPVVDVRVNPRSPGLASKERLFSGSPDSVYYHSSWFIDEFHKKNILTSLKHFPGHGSASVDSHAGLPDVSHTWSDMELEPYRKLFADGYKDAVMVAHLYNSQIDSVYPGSLSYNTITRLLRQQLGFEGVVITDELTMGAIESVYSMDKAAELAINAGADILLYKINDTDNLTSLVDHLQNMVIQKVREGIISEQRIDESYNRIIALKARYLNYTAVEESKPVSVPENFALQNYPNPFNPETIIMAEVPESSEISIKVYDLQGQMVEEVAKGRFERGVHRFRFNGSNLASGVYFVRMVTPRHSVSSKILLLR